MGYDEDNYLEFQKYYIERGINAIYLWDDFERELAENNRFLPDNEILSYFTADIENRGFSLKKGTVLYRARIDEGHLYEKALGIEMGGSLGKMLFEGFSAPKTDENRAFWGYDAAGSDAPKGRAGSGRANPEGICYLYAAGDAHTAIAEVRPNIDDYVSVCEIRIDKDLTLFNLADGGGDDTFELDIFTSYFSRPRNSYNRNTYYATQYISEYIKSLEFDGTRFRSSMNGDINNPYYNYVLFETHCDNYTITGSVLHHIKKIEIVQEQILPRTE